MATLLKWCGFEQGGDVLIKTFRWFAYKQRTACFALCAEAPRKPSRACYDNAGSQHDVAFQNAGPGRKKAQKRKKENQIESKIAAPVSRCERSVDIQHLNSTGIF